jgi:hypothetical protein
MRLDLVALMISDNKYKLLCFLLRNFAHYPVTFSMLYPSKASSTLFSITL